MGRAATTPYGVNWLTLVAMIAFHIGALAALFLFSWQRLLVAAVIYVFAVNVGATTACSPIAAIRLPSGSSTL